MKKLGEKLIPITIITVHTRKNLPWHFLLDNKEVREYGAGIVNNNQIWVKTEKAHIILDMLKNNSFVFSHKACHFSSEEAIKEAMRKAGGNPTKQKETKRERIRRRQGLDRVSVS